MLLQNQPYPQDIRVLHEARTLIEAGHQVTVICPRAPGQRSRDVVDGIQVRRFRLRQAGSRAVGYLWEYSYSMAASFALSIRVLLGSGFDVVHAHNPPDTFVAFAALYKRLGKRFVFDHHDLVPEMFAARFGREPPIPVRRVLLAFERWSLTAADRVISTNASYREMALARGGVDRERVSIVRNGPDLTTPPPSQEAGASGDGRIVIGYLGTIGTHDGVDYLLRALAYLVHESKRTDLVCSIAGTGEALRGLHRLARELKIENHVRFLGWLERDEADRFVHGIDIGVEPAPRNAYNDRCTMIKVLEYMAARKPVVGFDLRENRESAGDAAVFVSPNDYRELARGIASLADDPSRRRELGSLGRRRVEEGLAWSSSAPHLVKAYEALAAHDLLAPTSHTIEAPENRIDAGPSIPGAATEDSRYLAERYISAAPRASLLRTYYKAKPLVPRRVQTSFRQVLGQRRLKAGVVAWPIEDVLLRQRSERLARDLAEAGEDRMPFVNFWPGRRRFAVTLTHDVEGMKGLEWMPSVLEVEQRHGFVSSWNFVAEWYPVTSDDLDTVRGAQGEVGLHGIRHDGSLFVDRPTFEATLPRIRHYLNEWGAVGFRSPSTYRNADWIHELPCAYDSSFPQNDPWQPQPGGCCSMHPFFFGDVVELPITLDQDHTLFDLLGARSIELWVRKTRWLVANHGLVNLIVHPDYMTPERLRLYEDFLVLLKSLNGGWHALPREVAGWWRARSHMTLTVGERGEPVVTGPRAAEASVAWARPQPGRIAYEC